MRFEPRDGVAGSFGFPSPWSRWVSRQLVSCCRWRGAGCRSHSPPGACSVRGAMQRLSPRPRCAPPSGKTSYRRLCHTRFLCARPRWNVHLPSNGVTANTAAYAQTRWMAGQAPRSVSDTAWDLLLVCVAAYVFASIGRIHQVFPILSPLKPALITGAAAIVLYLLQQSGTRRISALAAPTTRYLLLLLLWI